MEISPILLCRFSYLDVFVHSGCLMKIEATYELRMKINRGPVIISNSLCVQFHMFLKGFLHIFKIERH